MTYKNEMLFFIDLYNSQYPSLVWHKAHMTEMNSSDSPAPKIENSTSNAQPDIILPEQF